MVKLVVLYGMPDDPDAFEDYYAGTHAALVEKIPGLQRFEAGKVLGTPEGQPAPYYWIAELYFESPDALERSLGSPEGQETVADVANFATGGASVMVVEA